MTSQSDRSHQLNHIRPQSGQRNLYFYFLDELFLEGLNLELVKLNVSYALYELHAGTLRH